MAINKSTAINKHHNGLLYKFKDERTMGLTLQNNSNNLFDKKPERPAVLIVSNVSNTEYNLYAQLTTKIEEIDRKAVKIPTGTLGVSGEVLPDNLFLAKKSYMKNFTRDANKIAHARLNEDTTKEVLSKMSDSSLRNAFKLKGLDAPEKLLKSGGSREIHFLERNEILKSASPIFI